MSAAARRKMSLLMKQRWAQGKDEAIQGVEAGPQGEPCRTEEDRSGAASQVGKS